MRKAVCMSNPRDLHRSPAARVLYPHVHWSAECGGSRTNGPMDGKRGQGMRYGVAFMEQNHCFHQDTTTGHFATTCALSITATELQRKANVSVQHVHSNPRAIWHWRLRGFCCASPILTKPRQGHACLSACPLAGGLGPPSRSGALHHVRYLRLHPIPRVSQSRLRGYVW